MGGCWDAELNFRYGCLDSFEDHRDLDTRPLLRLDRRDRDFPTQAGGLLLGPRFDLGHDHRLPLSVGIMCTSVLSRLHDENAELFQVPIMAGAALYVAAFAYSLFYNYRATRASAWLALSTTMLQQFSLLGVLFLILRLERRAMDRR